MLNFNHLTFGAEHEFADIPVKVPLPPGWGRDPEHTIVNSNGIAADPTAEKLYWFGGELNTPPTDTAEGQVEHIQWIKATFPEAKANYRSNLHIHVRVPGLRESLQALKRVQSYIHRSMAQAIEMLVPLPRPSLQDHPTAEELAGALRRWRRRRVSHRTLLTPSRLARQLKATTVSGFFDLEVPWSKKAGRPLYHAQPRLCVNLRQLKATDTIEFRHFPQTLDEQELLSCCRWCANFIEYAIEDVPIESLLHWAEGQKFPQFPIYVHEMERRFRSTVHDGTLPREVIARNIQTLEAEAKRFPPVGDLVVHWARVRKSYGGRGGPPLIMEVPSAKRIRLDDAGRCE